MTKRATNAVLAIIISLFLMGNFISPPVALALGLPGEIVDDIGGVASSLGASLAGLSNENAKREQFTKEFVTEFSNAHPDYNVVISHNGGQVSGDDVAHQHVELNVAFGTIGYEIYVSPKGKPFTFVRNGDGGYINWAFIGNFTRNDRTLTAG